MNEKKAEILEVFKDINYAYNDCTRYDTLKRMLDELTADVRENVKGEWIGEADGYADGELVYDTWYCGACGTYFEDWEEEPTWNFCPICGADMRSRLQGTEIDGMYIDISGDGTVIEQI